MDQPRFSPRHTSLGGDRALGAAVTERQPLVLGIDLGITMLMAENVRSGFVWDTFMKNPEARRGMERAGFQPHTAS